MDSVDSGSVIQVLDAFDAAWQQQATPQLEPYLPPADHPSRQSILVGLVSIDMERRLKARQVIRTEDYLERFPELRQNEEKLLELVLLEHRLRQQHGLGGSDDLYDRFPELADRLTVRLRETVPPIADRTSVVREAVGLDLREYVLLEALGQGGMGEVYRSRDPGLERDLALKVLRAKWQGHREAQSRFEQEARITGSLQHPGVVPVYNLGRLPDGRLYFTMKVVRGRTFAEILHQPGERAAEQRAEDIAVFEKVCQTLAYAHSKRVIHRDLKPANVMVGAFGEVQVMDWGLAKVLPREPVPLEAPTTVPASSMMPARSEDSALHSHDGDVLGTYAYMAPEQACGAVDRLDERCDVFGLGAVLCEVLTGQPPYTGPTAAVLRDRTMRADLGPALSRLEGCGADAELVELAKRCLAVEPADRLRTAGEVAQAVGAYLAGVQQRLREAEQKRAAAEARAVEAAARVKAERRARLLLLGLAAAVLVGALGGGWLLHQRAAAQAFRLQRDEAVQGILDTARGTLDKGWRLQDLATLNVAKAEADRAAAIAQSAGSVEMQQQTRVFQEDVEGRLRQREKNDLLRLAVLNVWALKENDRYKDDGPGALMRLLQPSIRDQYVQAFRSWGVDVLGADEAEVVARLIIQPEVVRQEVVAALDLWISHERKQNPLKADSHRLFRLAERLDPGERRRQLRALLVGDTLPSFAYVAGLVSAGPSWTALGALVRSQSWRLHELSRQTNPATEQVLTLVLLAGTSGALGDTTGAELLLRQSLATRPAEVVLLNALGSLLEAQGRSRLGEAIECYRAIRASRAGLGVELGRALVSAGRAPEGEAVLRDLVRRKPNSPDLLFYLGFALDLQKKLAEAESTFREAIRLKPDFPMAHAKLGVVLHDQKKLAEAEAAYREAIRLKPDLPEVYYNLGNVLYNQKKLAEAEAAYREAIRLKPDLPEAYANLGNVLHDQKKLADAEAIYREAIRIKPEFPEAHYNLGNLLCKQKKPAEAEAVYRKAFQCKPDFAEAHMALGLVLRDQKRPAEAEAAYREAIRIKPDLPEAHYNLGVLLAAHNKLVAAAAAYRKAVQFKPDYPEAYYGLGVVFHQQKKLDHAETAFRQAIRIRPDSPDAHYSLGIALAGQGKYAKAVPVYQKALALDSKNGHVYGSLGWSLYQLGKYAEALDALDKSVALTPDSAMNHNNRGIILLRLKRGADAETAFREALRLKHPNRLAVQTNILAARLLKQNTKPPQPRETKPPDGKPK